MHSLALLLFPLSVLLIISWNLLPFTRIAFAFIGASNGLTLIDVLRNESNSEPKNDCSGMGELMNRVSQAIQLNAACSAKRPS